MSDPRHRFGSDAEGAAAAWLERCGWRVLARRYRPKGGGEIDLVMLDPRRVLVGVEVRARHSQRAGAPEETVDARRARRIARSLAAFASGAGVAHDGLRVDLVAVEPIGPRPGHLRLRRLPDIGG
ncbi:MAG TPA: YraN family protein [Candidatus Limnocylindria bacterium]